MRRSLLLLAVALLGLGGTATARAADVPTHVVAANVNDAGIDPSRGANHIWLASDPSRRVGKLLVFMSGGGLTNLPEDWLEMGSQGGRLGYHTIVLAYRNEAPIQTLPPDGCGTSIDPPEAPPNCALNARMEILDGKGESPVVNVDPANSIENRLTKALVHLRTAYAGEGWAQFLDTGDVPKWSEIVVAGASLGAGEAGLIGMLHPVSRVVAFQGWTDAKHGWEKLGATPSSRYFALAHQREGLFARTCFAYVAFGLAQTCPLPAYTLVENTAPPFGSPQLVHNLEPFKLDGVADPYQTSTTRDAWLPRDADGQPARTLINAWRSVLGDKDADTLLDQVDPCPLVAYGPCPQGTVGGTVPATLALTLGPAATFGAFTPGVTRTYDASTTATVTSTAGDAALASSDPGRLTNGTFSLPEPLRVSLTPANWTAPVSNAAVSVAFTQLVKSTDALRTGTYSKVLTFTLSTTTP